MFSSWLWFFVDNASHLDLTPSDPINDPLEYKLPQETIITIMSQDDKVMEGAVNLARRWSVLNEPDMMQVRTQKDSVLRTHSVRQEDTEYIVVIVSLACIFGFLF